MNTLYFELFTGYLSAREWISKTPYACYDFALTASLAKPQCLLS